MATPVRLLLGLAVVCSVVPALRADCIWYGECNLDEKGFKQNCVYSGKAKKFTDASSIERLRGDCPSLFDENGDAYTCCDGNQAETLHSNMIKAAGVYSRCPSCFKNFFRIFCEMTCSPNQSDFIEIVSTQTNDDAKQYVTEINLFITENSMDKIYDSCKGVVMPQSGKYATDLTCGSYDSDSCTTKRWFEYMGEGNPFSPFTIKFTSTGGTFGDMTIVDIPSIACNESAGASSLACSCVDCPASCPASDNALFEPAEGNENVLVIVGVYTVILVTSASIAGRIYYRHRRRHRSKSTKGSYSSEDDQVSLTSNSHQKPRKVEVLGFKSEEFLENVFCCVGEACAKHPVLVFFLASWVLAVLIYPAPQIELVSTPIRLWASPYSQSLKNKDYFDQHFGPFYRAEQIFLKAVNLPKIHHTMMQGEVEFGPVFSREFLLKARELQLAIQDIGREDGLPLEEVCFAPLNNDFTGPVTVEKCTIATVWGYFQNSLEKFDQTGEKNGLPTNYLNVIYDCLQNSYDPACLAPYGGPAENLLVVGGFLNQANKTAIDSDALVLNFIVTNHLTDEENARAIEWEKKLIDFLLEWQKTEMPPWMDMAFMAERSIEDEIQRVSASSAGIIVLSYGIMLVYVAIALGRFSGWRRLLVDSKMGVALCGVGTVALSMLAAVGIFSYIRYPTILLTIEAVPFLVLAVGVDNLFILVDTHDRLLTEEKTGKPRPSVRRIGRTLGTAGPSMLLSSLAQEGCFLLGSLSEMPAVKSFALLAALALAINFVLQITVLMAVLALDERRKLSPRVDVMCCVRVQSCTAETVDGRLVKRFFESVLAPALMSRWTRRLVPVFFLCLLLSVVPLLPYVEVGLDQSLAMSKDSYVYKYFEFMKELLSIGPPVYFVVTKGLNYTATEHQNLVCGGIGCSPDSLSTAITAASKVSDLSHIARPASSWLDDLFDWTTLESCCKVFASNGSFCPHNRIAPECHTCSVTIDDLSRPSSADIRKFLPNFLLDIPDDDCAKGGIASYSAGVNFLLDKDGLATVGDTYFMGYHTPVRNSKEFYEALRSATKLCEKVEATINSRLDLPEPVRVFPYSVFYPFYEQYLTILKDTGVSLTYSMAMLFVAMTLLNGLDIVASAIVSSVVVVVLLELMAVMFMWGITLNAVSAVNLVVAMGIAVEFNAHIMHAFQKSTKGDRTARATEALVQTGSSVFSGIFLTKFSGIVVLYFAPIQILEVFYFRMYLSMVFLSAIHGLILLPVILSYIGPRVNRARVVKERQQRRENLLTTGHIS